MFDNSDNVNAYGATSMPAMSGSKKAPIDQEPAWKSDFRRTLDDIRDKGFGAYADEIHAKKMEELREKILASMGLTEGDLENMSPEQRNKIEKMIALEIQQRLAAEGTLDDDKNSKASPADGLADEVRAAPNGLGAGVLLMQELDNSHEPDRKNEAEKEESTG